MMRNRKTFFLGTAILTVLLVTLQPGTAVNAWGGDEDDNGIGTYCSTHVLPIMQKERSAFDDNLTPTERLIIAKVRDRIQRKVLGDETLREDQLIDRSDMNDLMDILTWHKKDLMSVREKLRPYYITWQFEIYNLVACDAASQKKYKLYFQPLYFLIMDPHDESVITSEMLAFAK